MNTALTVLIWIVIAWISLCLIGGAFALYRVWKDWR